MYFDVFVPLDFFHEDYDIEASLVVQLDIVIGSQQAEYEASDVRIDDIRLILSEDNRVLLSEEDSLYRGIKKNTNIIEDIFNSTYDKCLDAIEGEVESNHCDDVYDISKQEKLDKEFIGKEL